MGRITLGALSTSQVETQSKLETPTSLGIHMTVRVDEIRALANGTFRVVGGLPNKSLQIGILRDTDGGNNSAIYCASPTGNVYGTLFDLAALFPANGNDIVLSVNYTGGGSLNIAAGTPNGAAIISSTHGSGLANLATSGTDLARIRINSLSFDKLAFTAPRTGNARFATPLATDGDMIALFDFEEGSGTASADLISGGLPFTLNNYTWETSGGGGGSANVLRYLQDQARMAGIHPY